MKARLLIPSLLFLLASFNIASRSLELIKPPISNLEGKVIDESGQVIVLGNALLLAPQDSSLIQGEVFYDGLLRMPDIPTGNYLLRVTALGFADYFLTVQIPAKSGTIDLGTVALKLTMLAEVEVTALRKVYTQTGDGLVVNVAQTALANAGSVVDLLRNTPKVITDRAGGFALLGKGAAIIYLDGQRLNTPAILESLSAQDVKRIEILDNPPARFEAEGNAVINIVTNGKGKEGYRFTLLQAIEQGKYFRAQTRGTAYLKTGKLFLQGTAGIEAQNRGSRFRQLLTYPGDYRNDNNYAFKSERRPHNLELRAGYELSPRHQLQFQYQNNVLKGENTGNNHREVTESGTPIFSLNSLVQGPFTQRNENYQLLSSHSLDTLGSSLQIGAQHTSFSFDRSQQIDQSIDQGIRMLNRQSLNRNDISVVSGQVDVEKYLTPTFRWASGLKFAVLSNGSFSGLDEVSTDGTSTSLPEFTNNFDFNESVLAAYLEAGWQHQGWKLNAGLRGEQTTTEGRSNEALLFDRSYLNLFPTVSVTRQLGEQNSASLSYGYRINRPLLQDLNPYILYFDSLVTLRGNPNLLPEYSHNITGSLNYEGWNLNLSYVHTDGKINQLFRSPDPARPEIIAFVKENLRYTKLYSATVSRPLSGKWWSAYITAGIFYDHHAIADLEQQLNNTKTGVYLRLAPSITLPGKLKFDAVLNYTSPRVDGVYDDNSVSYLNLSLSRKFFNERLTTTLWANDVFDDFRFTGVSHFNGTRMDYLSEGDWHYIKLMFNWNFGKLGNRRWKSKRGAGAEEGRILKN